MSRIILFIVVLVSTSYGFSQTEKSVLNEEKLLRLQQKNVQLNNRVKELESALFAMRNDLAVYKNEINSQITKSQELQAQNERSMNLALDGFSDRFEKQNETVKGVQKEIKSKFMNQLLLFAAGIVVLVIVFTMASRAATQKALSQNASNWNDFQEHMLKK